jgi:hypothetical protein
MVAVIARGDSDEAIQHLATVVDRFASLAMTKSMGEHTA